MFRLCNTVIHPLTGEKFQVTSSTSQDTFEKALNFPVRANDIFICTYPKSGTTWVQNITWLIAHKGYPVPNDKTRTYYLPFLEFFDKYSLQDNIHNDLPRIIKTHFPYPLVVRHPNAKYIFVERNPKDVCVSLYYHLKGFTSYDTTELDFNTYFPYFMKGDVVGGDYWSYHQSRGAARNDPNCLFIRYEDLKKDTKSEVLRIAEFLGENYKKDLLANKEELLEIVLEQSNINSMRKENDAWALIPRRENFPFIRKGIVGDWKNHLTKEQANEIDARSTSYQNK